MKTTKAFLIIFSIFFMAQGCIPSLHPLYTKDKLVKVDALQGGWTDNPGAKQITKNKKVFGKDQELVITLNEDDTSLSSVWDFRQREDGQYLLIHQDDEGRKAAFDVHIIKLGNDLFMDFYPSDLPEKDKSVPTGLFDDCKNDLMSFHLLPVHTFAKLIIDGDKMSIKMFDPDFLEKLLERKQIRIKHEKLTDAGYVLSAQPEELQKFVAKYGQEKEAYIRDLIELTKTDDR